VKFLADMGVSMTVVRNLREAGYEAIHLREEGLQRLPDPEILEKARQEERIVLTFDLDFGDLLAASSALLPSVIIFRLQNTLPSFASARLLEVLSECSEDLETGAIVMIEDGRYRLRRLPI
jgi:predicted nuclease of predicted toxin-antitoxin system